MSGEYINLILLAGLVFKAFGFLLRDELVLRVFVLVGLGCDMLFYGLQPIPIWQSVMTNALLLTINVTLVVLILFERTTFRMTPREKALFAHFPTLKPGQFRRILRHSSWHRYDRPVRIAAEGAPLDSLYFLPTDSFEIEKQGKRFTARGPAFVGELAFLGGGVSSASVWVPANSEYVAFATAPLHKAMQRSGALNNAMVALFGADLARKVANSVPMTEPTPTPPPPPHGDPAKAQS